MADLLYSLSYIICFAAGIVAGHYIWPKIKKM